MPHISTPVEQLLPSQAARKRQAAEKRELQAIRLRAEAAELERRWREYVATREERRHVSAG